ncbi:hypothetical protein JD844_016483 [Phrynosoma platyrhinos]|uniref:Uncharacterized protein n=1 Tax=Phrynosoma platyrhinos TaxID=52577 RepID=A0ABQ7SKJ1_PHRPL|nr:hypothetical protein JD844_016483 [Phrynosoma platyrhinos]
MITLRGGKAARTQIGKAASLLDGQLKSRGLKIEKTGTQRQSNDNEVAGRNYSVGITRRLVPRLASMLMGYNSSPESSLAQKRTTCKVNRLQKQQSKKEKGTCVSHLVFLICFCEEEIE